MCQGPKGTAILLHIQTNPYSVNNLRPFSSQNVQRNDVLGMSCHTFRHIHEQQCILCSGDQQPEAGRVSEGNVKVTMKVILRFQPSLKTHPKNVSDVYALVSVDFGVTVGVELDKLLIPVIMLMLHAA